VTYPGVFGSRVGGVGRVVAAACAGGAGTGAAPTTWAIAGLPPVSRPITVAIVSWEVVMDLW
jgi:hypothetical protein